VKRLIGLPGETVHEDAQTRIWIDGQRLSEPYVSTASRTADKYRGQSWHVTAGSEFMLGDNRGGSCDSRPAADTAFAYRLMPDPARRLVVGRPGEPAAVRRV
jgi:signal peptidase I